MHTSCATISIRSKQFSISLQQGIASLFKSRRVLLLSKTYLMIKKMRKLGTFAS